MPLADRMSRRSSPLASLCGLLDGREGAYWSSSETGLVTLARRHRVEPLLHVRLANASSGWRAAKETLDALAQDYRTNAARVLQSLAWLQQLTQALAAEGIEARPLKGLPLAAQAYQRIADRHCGDLDLLIGSHRLRGRADVVVRTLGLRPHLELTETPLRLYRALYKDDCYLAPDGLRVELHYHRDGVGQHLFPDFMAFASPAWQTCRVESAVTHRLYGAPLLLYLLCHGTRSRWHRLKWLLDIRQLTRGFDAGAWIELHNAAERENMQLATQVGLQLLHGAFAVPSLPTLQSGPGYALRGWSCAHCQGALNDESELSDSAWAILRNTPYNLLVQRNWRARLAVAGSMLLRFPDIAHWKMPIPLLLLLTPMVRLGSFVHRRAVRPVLRRLFP